MSDTGSSGQKYALEGITVLDFSQGWGGPGGTMLLADQGADVIKIEPLQGEQGRGFFANEPIEGEERGFLVFNRGKRGIALNLKDPKGIEAIERLVKKADVLLHNFRPGVAERLGIDYATLKKINPTLIYASLSGFGKKGPYANHRAYDAVLQAMAGLLHRRSPDGTPLGTGLWVSDTGTAMMLAYAVTLALYARGRTGEGQQVDLALLNQALFMELPDLIRTPEEMEIGLQSGYSKQLWDYHTPCRCKDGKFILPVAMTNDQWKSLCRVLDLDRLAEQHEFNNAIKRFRQGDILHDEMEQAFERKDRAEWVTLLQKADVPHAPLIERDEVLKHPQLVENGLVEEIDHPKCGKIFMLGIPFRLSKTPGAVRGPAPLLGQHSREILLEIGYSEEEIATMVESGVIGMNKISQ
jgi:crotonobetainyl-CoA:carnitine CoA-transferase CaiB-like acyl-CoA transferase